MQNKRLREVHKLLTKWGGGLTPPFICQAVGVQPARLIEPAWYNQENLRLGYCGGLRAPLVLLGSRNDPNYRPRIEILRQFGFLNSEEAENEWSRTIDNPIPFAELSPALLIDWTTALLLENRCSARGGGRFVALTRKTGGYLVEDTLGHPPYKVIDITTKGGIVYASDWQRIKRKGPAKRAGLANSESNQDRSWSWHV